MFRSFGIGTYSGFSLWLLSLSANRRPLRRNMRLRRILLPRATPMPVVTNIEDLRRIARKRLPRVMFDYVDSGSYDEITRDANRDELKAIKFRQRVLVDTTGRTMETELLGTRLAMPVAIAPTGLTGLVYGDGEML